MTQAYNLAILANAVNTSGQLNVGTNATGTLPVANGGTGQSTLTANNVVLGNGTSGVQFVAPSTNGNVLTSNGTTWVSQAPAGGGVTSLNGQTGAITDTSLYAIGSYTWGRPQSTTNYAPGNTVAGTSLYQCTGNGYWNQDNNLWLNLMQVNGGVGAGQSLVNTGTWRNMNYSWGDSAGCSPTLWVRIS